MDAFSPAINRSTSARFVESPHSSRCWMPAGLNSFPQHLQIMVGLSSRRRSAGIWAPRPATTGRQASSPDPAVPRALRRRRSGLHRLAVTIQILQENRNGLVVDTRLTLATGTAEREAAHAIAAVMAERKQRATLGAERAKTRGIS